MDSTKLLLAFAAAFSTGACAAQQRPLAATAAASLKGRRVATTVRVPTAFFVTAPGKSGYGRSVAMFGAAGGLVAAEHLADAGGRILRENDIADPATQIATQLRDELTRRYGTKVDPRSLYMAEDDPTHVIAAHPEADLLLDVRVDNLSLGPFSEEPSKYGLAYAIYFRLIDARIVHAIDGTRGDVIADGGCSQTPKKTSTAPTYDQLLADKAQRLKRELDLVTQSCVHEFRTKVLTAGGAPNTPAQERP